MILNRLAPKCAIALTHAFFALWKMIPYKTLLMNTKKTTPITTVIPAIFSPNKFEKDKIVIRIITIKGVFFMFCIYPPH